MGEGQEKVARDKNNAAFVTGGWLVLQNCHLGIDYMNEVEDLSHQSHLVLYDLDWFCLL